MKPEPLTKEKIGRVVLKEVKGLKILWEESKPKIVSVEDVKNAVQWVLKEIERLKRNRNPYSEKVFPEPTKNQWKKRNEALEKAGLSPDQFSGSLCRLGWNTVKLLAG